MKDNDIILEQLLELNIKKSIKDSNTNIRLLDNRIKFYQTLLNNLEKNKPLFFQKKKLVIYNNKIKEYKSKIKYFNIELQKEKNLLDELYRNM